MQTLRFLSLMHTWDDQMVGSKVVRKVGRRVARKVVESGAAKVVKRVAPLARRKADSMAAWWVESTGVQPVAPMADQMEIVKVASLAQVPAARMEMHEAFSMVEWRGDQLVVC